MNILQVRELTKTYGLKGNVTRAIKNIEFSVEKGEFVAVMGPSGSGKTTLLNLISTIDRATSGEILVDGANVTKLTKRETAAFRRDKLGFVFQDFNLIDAMPIDENIALALSIAKDTTDMKARVEKIAETLGIAQILKKYPHEISGGEKQRASAARAVIKNPALILADEPTGALDTKSAKRLMETFLTLNESLGSTILMVTHDGNMASYASRVLFLKDGEIFNEIRRGDDSQRDFYERIMDTIGFLGGMADA